VPRRVQVEQQVIKGAHPAAPFALGEFTVAVIKQAQLEDPEVLLEAVQQLSVSIVQFLADVVEGMAWSLTLLVSPGNQTFPCKFSEILEHQ
jgi:hypothetical protein